MIEQWRKQLSELSRNLTTNEVMPEKLVNKLLEEDESLKEKLVFEEIIPPKLGGVLGEIEGLNILSELQKLKRKDCLTLFRAVRFPTCKRIYDVATKGYAISNYEQERILDLYQNGEYLKKREDIKSDHRFWIQPQERVVHGLPLFCLANDAIQIHRAFRGEKDKVVIIALYIPHELLETGKIKLTANTAIDLDYENKERDFKIKDFYKKDDIWEIDYEALRARGIDLHEMYSNDLPLDVEKAKKLGITEDYFLLDIYKVNNDEAVKELFQNTETLKKNKHFLHGFFGDQNIFGRRSTTYLPYKISRFLLK